jgi:hypothetical protein
MSAGQYKDNEDKDAMGYESSRRAEGEEGIVRVSPANRDTWDPAAPGTPFPIPHS